jgi:hypothetical protein
MTVIGKLRDLALRRSKKYITFSLSFPEDQVEINCGTGEWKGTREKRNWRKDLVEIQSKEPRRINRLAGGAMNPNPVLEVFSDYV